MIVTESTCPVGLVGIGVLDAVPEGTVPVLAAQTAAVGVATPGQGSNCPMIGASFVCNFNGTPS